MGEFSDVLLSVRWQGLSRLMAMETGKRPRNRQVEQLLTEGQTALAGGDAPQAHTLWRKAAALDPYDERIWLRLFSVVEGANDRRACLENIVALNPLNAEARRLLRAEQEVAKQAAREPARRAARARRQRMANLTAFQRAVVIGLIAGLVGVVLGVAASILVFGTGVF